MTPLITDAQLRKAQKVLYLTHLALGDFLYQKTFLIELVKRYPHLQLDVWTDRGKRKRKRQAQNAGRNRVFEDWFKYEPCLHHYYGTADSYGEFKTMLGQAQSQNYDIVFFHADFDETLYARLANKIAPLALKVGNKQKPVGFNLLAWLSYRKLDSYYLSSEYKKAAQDHITERYAFQFERMLGLKVEPQSRKPNLLLPPAQVQKAKLWLDSFRADYMLNSNAQTLAINPYSTTAKRDMPEDQLQALLLALDDKVQQKLVVVLVPPHKLEVCEALVASIVCKNIKVRVFTAQHSIFELIALVSLMDKVLSVETAVMHFANALNVPLLALMRLKTQHWAPLDNGCTQVLFCEQEGQWVKDISLQRICSALFSSGSEPVASATEHSSE